MLSVIATIKVKTEAVGTVKAEMLRLVTETVREEGCGNYNLHQDNDDPSVFVFYENWSDEAALVRHLESQHVRAYIEATKGMIEKLAINKLSRLA